MGFGVMSHQHLLSLFVAKARQQHLDMAGLSVSVVSFLIKNQKTTAGLVDRGKTT